MIITVGNWNIEKAGDEDDKVVKVRMVANSLAPDRENEEILPQAFSPNTVKEFIDNGIIDWHHQSVLGKSHEERARAILGKPYAFQWENGKPTVYAALTKDHPIVKNSILPHLEAKQAVFGASVGGSVKKARNVLDDNTRKPKTQILEINWNHLALAGLPYVINPGTAVSMVKAYGADDLMITYSDISAFQDQVSLVNREVELSKAIMAGTGTNIADYVGGDAIKRQSLEGAGRMFGRGTGPRDGSGPGCRNPIVSMVIMGVTDQTIEPSREGIERYLNNRGITDRREIEAIFTDFKRAVRNFVVNPQ